MSSHNKPDNSDSRYYEVLGVNSSASDEEIKSAYRDQTKEYHPDKSDHPDATDLTADVNQAKDWLLNGGGRTAGRESGPDLNYVWRDGTPRQPSDTVDGGPSRNPDASDDWGFNDDREPDDSGSWGDDNVDDQRAGDSDDRGFDDDWTVEDEDIGSADPDPTPDDVNLGDDETTGQEATAYRFGRVIVTPAPSGPPNAYEYSDLRRPQTPWILRYPFVLAFWISYLIYIFPFQYLLRGLRWRFWENSSVGFKTRMLVREAKINMQKLNYLANSDRRRLYLRASRLYTPSQLFPFLAGTVPEPENTSVESPPYPRDWDTIRREIYERDGYRCVNCGRGGGPKGDAELHADHVLPRSRGGPDELPNIRTLCRSCHGARHARILR